MIEVTDVALRQAAGEGMDAFIGVFTGAYKKEIGGEMTAGRCLCLPVNSIHCWPIRYSVMK